MAACMIHGCDLEALEGDALYEDHAQHFRGQAAKVKATHCDRVLGAVGDYLKKAKRT